MWAAHVSAQGSQATMIGNMMPYPTQPTMQYQPCFISPPPPPTPVQPTSHGMYYNSPVQSYNVMPQQYIPVQANRGFRPHVGMGQPSNVPCVMHQDYVPVAGSGFPTHRVPGPHNQLVGTPSIQLQTRPVAFEIPSVHQAQLVPHYSKPSQHFATFIQNRPETSDQQVAHCEHTQANLITNISSERRETEKIQEKKEEKAENLLQSSSPEEEQTESHQPTTETVTVSVAIGERVPTPIPLPMFQELDDAQTTDEVKHSPSETTLVPSPLSSDGVQTLCNSPIHADLSDSEEELTTNEDDQIPTKDTNRPIEFALVCSSVERLEPEHPYDLENNKPFNQEQHTCDKLQPSKEHEPCSSDQAVSGSFEKCSSVSLRTNQNQYYHRSIRSLIDSPVYNTSHSTVLCQLTQSSNSLTGPCIEIRRRPLTTHFRQLFKPMSPTNKTQDKAN